MTPQATRTLHRALLLLAAIGFAIAAIVLLTRDASAPGWKATQQKYFALKGEGGAPQMRVVPVTWAASEHPTGWAESKAPTDAVAVDRCMTCHLGADDPQMSAAEIPRELRVHSKRDVLFKSHPIADFGCSSCHGGNSAATDMTAHAAPDFRAGGPAMQSSCGSCHTIDEHLAGAETFARGRKLFVELDCGGCHRAPGPVRRDRAASMFDAPVKTSAAWLLGWLRDPSIAGASASTRHMPAFWPKPDAASKKETLDVAAFLFARGDGEGRRAKVRGYANVPGASADEGEEIWKALGCRSCHAEIGGHATEDFLAYYIEDPARVWAHTRMPSFRLVRREAASLAKYLERAAAARPGYVDPAAVPGVDPDEIAIVTTGARRAERAPCTAANDVVLSHVECGEKIAASRGCASCHASEGIVLERRDALDLHAWGKSPGTPATRASRVIAALGGDAMTDAGAAHGPTFVGSAMPKYTLAADDATGLATYLEGLRGGSPRPPFYPYTGTRRGETLAGEALWDRLHCNGCHARDGSRPSIEGAPSLDGEGRRAQAEWLATFLRDPGAHGVRPSVHPEWAWGELVPPSKLATRMPTFALGNDERTAIVRWLALSDGGVFPYGAPDPPRFVPDDVMSALVFVNRAEPPNGGCMTCHFTGAFPVERAKAHAGELAPNLGGVRARLRPDWVRKLLVGQVPATPHAATVPKERVDRITDFLFALGEHTELPRPGDEARTPILGLPR
ncbi:MAG: putative octahem cytochrome c [Myxococcaceae bacterium]|nr:putative octahem cytochrome c [Myxococcaceae bacterium]